MPANRVGGTLAKPTDGQAIVRDQRTPAQQRLNNDWSSNVWRFRTDRFGGITESITTLGFIRTIVRNADGQPLNYTEPDPDGDGPAKPLLSPVTRYGYNAFADPIQVTAPDGATTRMNYSANLHRLTSITDPVGRTQNFVYNVNGTLQTSADGGGFITSMTYTTRGLVNRVNSPDPDGVGPLLPSVTTFAYDAFGRLIQLTNPDGSPQTFSYNTADQLLSSTDELGKASSFTYDALGRMLTKIKVHPAFLWIW